MGHSRKTKSSSLLRVMNFWTLRVLLMMSPELHFSKCIIASHIFDELYGYFQPEQPDINQKVEAHG